MKWRLAFYVLCGVLVAAYWRTHTVLVDVDEVKDLRISNAEAERVAYGRQIRHLLQSGAYDSLDGIAARLRRTKARDENGWIVLRSFYKYGFSTLEKAENPPQYATLVARLREWRRARPRSVTAHVALAYGLMSYAWQARGSGWAYQVSDSGARLMAIRLAEATEVLAGARQLSDTCPAWWAVAMTIANLGGDDATFERLFQEAITYDRSYDSFYLLKAAHLQPQWHGRPGEWERFALATANSFPEPQGSELYALLIADVYESDFRGRDGYMFEKSQASWSRTYRGFLALRKRYPHSVELLSEFLLLAGDAGDGKTVKRLIKALGNRCDLGVWGSETSFVYYRAWAWAQN